MTKCNEYIRFEHGYPDAWLCICGNTPGKDGFFPCDTDGNEVEPTPADWRVGLYVCGGCGRMIDQKSLEVVDRAAKFRALSFGSAAG